MLRKSCLWWLVVAITASLIGPNVQAAGIVLNPNADIWIREYLPDNVYDADFISVWSRNTSPAEDGDNARYGVLSFDLSSVTVPITSARLELYLVDYSRNNANPCQQDAFLVTPPVTDDSTLSWNSYHATTTVETSFEGLGVYDLPAVKPVKQMYRSTATAADVALLEAQRTNGAATFVLKARDLENPLVEEEFIELVGGRHDWADLEHSDASYPVLLLNNSTIAVVASDDTWVRQVAPDTQYTSDKISVWNSEGAESTARTGVLEFNLSGLPAITDAKLSLYSIVSSASGYAFEQKASLLEAATMPLTWNQYVAADSSTFESLGHYLLDDDAPENVYIESDLASSADVAALNAIRTGDGTLIMGLEGFQREITTTVTTTLAGSLDWADTESTYLGYGNEAPASNSYMWPRLIINDPRFPGDANEDGTVDDKDASILGANWLAAFVGWGGGDFNEDGVVNDKDAAIMAAHFGQNAPTESGVPEPSSVVLLLCGLAALAVTRRRAAS